MTAGELVVVLAALLCAIGFAALVVVLMRVLDTLRDLQYEVVDLRAETRPLLAELRETTDEARVTVDEAREDLERFDRVLGSAEAIGDAVSGRVARTAFSSPAIKAAGLAKGTSRAFSRLRGTPRQRRRDLDVRPPIDVADPYREIPSQRRRRRA
ncbi:MAG: DUF948 domain-containing protein [Ilumatobacteraceae bacterium]